MIIDNALEDAQMNFLERLERFIRTDMVAQPTLGHRLAAHVDSLLYFCAGFVCALAVTHVARGH